MGGRRRQMLVGLAVAMFLGVAVYLRLWTIDYHLSSNDTELLRRQFDLANREAMDESAEWRHRYDKEVERSTKCFSELSEIKNLGKKAGTARIDKKLEMLQKENVELLKQVESLKLELEVEKKKCSML